MERTPSFTISEYDEGSSHFFQTNDGSLAEVEIADTNLILHGIAVSDGNRGRGIGSELLKLVELYATKNGCREITGVIGGNSIDGDPSEFYIKHQYSINAGAFKKDLEFTT